MGGASIWHWIVVGLIVVLLFGRGKISDMMGDVAKGIKAFKKGMAEDDKPAEAKPDQMKTIDNKPNDLKERAATEKKFEGGTV